MHLLSEFGEDVAEEGVVGGDAVVEVYGDSLFGYHLETFVVFLALFDVGTETVEAAAFGSGEISVSDFKTLDFGTEPVHIFQQIAGAHLLHCVGVHTMHIDQRLESTFFRCKEPVDRAVLIHLLVVFPEVFLHIVLDFLAEAFLNEVEIVGLCLLAPYYAHEVGNIFRQVVVKRRTGRKNWDDAIIINRQNGIVRPIFI